jgi:hypothetical protein
MTLFNDTADSALHAPKRATRFALWRLRRSPYGCAIACHTFWAYCVILISMLA